MSTRDCIIALLRDNPDGLDDDQLAERLGLPQRQQANSRCRELARESLVERRSVGGKIRNFWTGAAAAQTARDDAVAAIPTNESGKAWFWEGNVVRAVASYLTNRGWTIDTIANTVTGEPGADIKATRQGQTLLVEVKGYPSKFYERGPNIGQPKRTNPATQARHWVAEALLTALLRQSESHTTQVAMAFPNFEVYTKLLARIRQSISQLGLMVLIIGDSGSVEIVQDGSRIARP